MFSGRIALLSLLTLTVAACHASTDDHAVELTLFERGCFDENDGCDEAGAGEYHQVPALLVVEEDGRGALGALHLWFTLRRPNSTRAAFELHVRPGASAPEILYDERRYGEVRFSAEKIAGRIEVGRDPDCPCQIGRLDLLLTAPGADGKLGTPDDDIRRLTEGRLRQDERPFCHGRQRLEIREDLLVLGSPPCPGKAHAPARGGSAACKGGTWIGSGWNDDGWYDEACDACNAWTDDGWTDEGWTDDGWTNWWTDNDGSDDVSDDGWTDDGWTDDGWTDDGWTDDGSDDWWDDGGSDDGWDDGWTDDGFDDGSDDGGDDDWWDDGASDDWWDDGGDDEWDDDDW